MLNKLSLLAALPLPAAAETVLGVYVFSRHGDRTSKSTPPTNLTDLGYAEVYASAGWFRDQYIAAGAPKQIAGISEDLVALSQLALSAPQDNVLMSSAVGFAQGLYPPVGSSLGSNQLRNGSTVQAPLGGYQIVPVQQTTSGTGSESSAWLQGSSNCANAIVSSNSYFFSDQYETLLKSTQGFYDGVAPMINSTFAANQTSFKNAYTIFDYLNVANIHNETFPSSDLLTNSTMFQLRTLADNHEFNLAYNASESIRAIAGSTLAAQVVQALNATVSSGGKKAAKLNVQFGAYGTFQSYFGLANLTALGANWIGVPDYASSMTWELFTNASSADPFPSADDLNVRFFFGNGSASNASAPSAFPLFGQQSTVISWNDFVTATNKFAIGDQADWCSACGNTTGVCASSTDSSTNSSGVGSSDASASSGGITPTIGGVIGAMVTLAVILGLEAIVLLAGGLRVVSKKRIGASSTNAATGATAKNA